MPQSPPKSAPPAKDPLLLSPREREVATWLGEDDTYAQIAVRLGVGHETIRVHARNVIRKMAVRTRHAAVARLIGRGIVPAQKGN